MSSITLAQLAETVPDLRVLAVTFSQSEYRFHLKRHPAEFGLTAFRAHYSVRGARCAVQSSAQMGWQQLVADMGEEARRQPRIVTATLRLGCGGSRGARQQRRQGPARVPLPAWRFAYSRSSL